MVYYYKVEEKGLVYVALRSTERTLRRCMRKLVRLKKLENITISEICEMSEIGKRTFYRYYADKYALFEDTYIREFYNKLDITDDLGLFEIYQRMAAQMYEEREFFLHALAAKGQNGFWEVISNLVHPHIGKLLTADPYIDRVKDYYIRKDIEVVLQHMEEWLMGGCKVTPEELIEYIRLCNALHGKWQYQVCMGKEPDKYSLEKFKNDEW